MTRLFRLQQKMITEIYRYGSELSHQDYSSEWEIIHMISCARIAQLLAGKRGSDAESAAIAASLHDFGRIVSGLQKDHAEAGYEPVKSFLSEYGDFSPDEIESCALAVKNHSSKKLVGTPIEEIVKDADVLDCWEYGLELERPEQRARLEKVLKEIG